MDRVSLAAKADEKADHRPGTSEAWDITAVSH